MIKSYGATITLSQNDMHRVAFPENAKRGRSHAMAYKASSDKNSVKELVVKNSNGKVGTPKLVLQCLRGAKQLPNKFSNLH